MTRDQALEAWLKSGDPASRDACVEAWLPLVKRVWARLRVTLPPAADTLTDDLLQCGCMGLVKAVESFKDGLGVPFEAWARLRVRGAMLDELRRQDPLSKERRQRWKGLQNAVRELEQRLGRACDEEELARHLGLSLEDLRDALLANAPAAMVFLDGLTHDGSLPVLERLPDPGQSAADARMLDAELKAALADAIGGLAPQERTLLVLLLHEELGQKEAALVLGVTPGRISQIYAKAVLHLQAALTPRFKG